MAYSRLWCLATARVRIDIPEEFACVVNQICGLGCASDGETSIGAWEFSIEELWPYAGGVNLLSV